MIKVCNTPKSLQYLAVKACCSNENKHIRLVSFELETGIISNQSGTLVLQLRNKSSLRKNVLQFVETCCNK